MSVDRTAPTTVDAARPLQLGPLVRTDDHWVIGDHTRKAHLALLPEGMEHRVVGEEPELVAWSRFRGIHLQVACDPVSATRTFALLTLRPSNPWAGAELGSRLRDPEEDWRANYTHHRALYSFRHILLLRFMLMHVSCEHHTELLGEDTWLTWAVGKLAPLRCYQETTALRMVEETLGDLRRRPA
ncbi:hypothetical protein [Kitasatospora aureofaciens]|uniref:hypothetical protein n=1 Tax=Kitasatospora aureofaciens TaxID=1894 RepID=UPI000524B0A7|nr:hypothetical protein [Kitasatospora aureofaciens]HJD80729.1 hypothetical protein [Kitasatospora aureofaciens]